ARVPGRRMVFEPLESRLLPSADFVGVEVPAPDALTAVASVFFVSTTGSDANDGLTPGTAFRTIQRAITEAGVADGGDDEIRVAAGIYNTPGTDLALAIPASDRIDNLTVIGGFDPTFTLRAPGTTLYIPQNAGNIVAADVD